MLSYPPTIIFRHRKENVKKCSLSGLETREDMQFFTYPTDTLPNLKGYIHLKVGEKPLAEEDRNKGIFLIDATWRYAEVIENSIPKMEMRSFPVNFETAYPRKQTGCPKPKEGLASVEALYLAYHLLQRKTEGILDSYYWKTPFLNKNGFSIQQ